MTASQSAYLLMEKEETYWPRERSRLLWFSVPLQLFLSVWSASWLWPVLGWKPVVPPGNSPANTITSLVFPSLCSTQDFGPQHLVHTNTTNITKQNYENMTFGATDSNDNNNNNNNFISQWTYIGLYHGEAGWPNSSLISKQASELHRRMASGQKLYLNRLVLVLVAWKTSAERKGLEQTGVLSPLWFCVL